MHIVVMGPSGSGKSVVGSALAASLAVPFVDADDLHPTTNIAKMSEGTPLDDGDRMPWLDVVAARISGSHEGVVVACSALARRYRERILIGAPQVRFVQLSVAAHELDRRMTARTHFMPPALLASQLATLEHLGADEPGAVVENSGALDDVVARARVALGV